MKKKLLILYEIIMCLLALIAVTIALWNLCTPLPSHLLYIDYGITVIFIVDYFIRFIVSEDKKRFLKENVLDLIAIIPFNSIFKVFRIAKIFRFAKLFKFIRMLSFFVRAHKRIQRFIDTNGFKYMLYITGISILLGTITVHYFEDYSYFDSFWWAIVTITTVGYGDLTPVTTGGRIIAIALMCVGIGLFSTFASTMTSFFLYENKNSYTDYKHTAINDIKKQLDNLDNLTDQDIDNIASVLKALNKKERRD